MADILSLRADCLVATHQQSQIWEFLAGKRLAITGGTGFLGTWLAEMIVALNDQHNCAIKLDIFARHTSLWAAQNPHLADRTEIGLHNKDVRAPFEFPPDTAYVIHAAGVPDNREHASDPLRVFQTTVLGTQNALNAASKLSSLIRVLNVSSGLVNGSASATAILETDCLPFNHMPLHAAYPEAKRAAENLCGIYGSQFRLPISIVRPFTFSGPHQSLERPWAINSFMRDALMGHEIRLHGDGQTCRSYLFGSDAAWGILTALVRGQDGRAYNLGSTEVIRHIELAEMISSMVRPEPRVVLRTMPENQMRASDFYPDMQRSLTELNLPAPLPLRQALARTLHWQAEKLGLAAVRVLT